MVSQADAQAMVEIVRTVRQARQYRPEPVPDALVEQLLQVARWTGSSRNSQPWRFIAITDRDLLRQISQLRTPINWLVEAPLGIASILNGDNEASEAYDEGRVTERLLIAAHALGLGGGVAWYGEPSHRETAKQLLGIPAERTARSVVAIGYPVSTTDPRPTRANPGRKPLADLVSRDRWTEPAN